MNSIMENTIAIEKTLNPPGYLLRNKRNIYNRNKYSVISIINENILYLDNNYMLITNYGTVLNVTALVLK